MQFITILAGHNFRPSECKAALAEIRLGVPHTLTLERDPENPYDSNAIKIIATLTTEGGAADQGDVHHDSYFIGFVAGADNSTLALLMDNRADDEMVAPGHTPTVDRVEIIDWVSGDKKPTIVIEVSTGYEVGTLVTGPDEDQDGDDDFLPSDEDEPGED